MWKRVERVVPVLLSLALLLSASVMPAAALKEKDSGNNWETDLQLLEEYAPNVIIIQFKDASAFPGKEKQYQDEVKKVLGTGFEEIWERTYLVKVEDLSKNPQAVLNRFKNNQFIEYVEPDYIGSMEQAPSDPLYTTRGFAFSKQINAESGWDIATASSVTVAVVDTGYSGNDDLPAVSGYSVYNKSNDVTDVAGHGTQVSGTVGALGNNDNKSAGVVWNAKILPVKVSESSTVTVSNVAPAIIYAADHGAKIINLSLSFPSNSTTLKNAVDYAHDKGCLLVAAAGNDGAANVSYPAAYDNVLGVGGTTNGETRYGSSNYGTGLDVLAGWSWYSTTIRGTNTISSGTSIAAPQVSGLAALVWGMDPSLSNDEVMWLIRDNTNRADGNWDAQTGYGTIDMGKTLAAVGGGAAQPDEPATEEPKPDEPAAVEPEKDTTPPVLTLKGEAKLTLTEGDSFEEPGYTAQDDRDGDMTQYVTVSGTVSTAYAGEYVLTYRVVDRSGNAAEATRTVVVEPAPVPEPDEPTAPTITQVGSNPIILHLGGTPYTEQGAVAYDEQDGDLSAFVTTSGEVDTSKAGTYEVEYSVTNSAGLSASVTREVRVLAPQETVSRTPYSFSGQGKAKASQTYRATADAAGEVSLSISGLNKTTLAVTVTDSSGSEVFSGNFTGNETRTFQVAEGDCQIKATIVSAKGNSHYDLSLLMPEVTEVGFEQEEVPLSALPTMGAPWAATAGISAACFAVGVVLGFFIKKRKLETGQ